MTRRGPIFRSAAHGDKRPASRPAAALYTAIAGDATRPSGRAALRLRVAHPGRAVQDICGWPDPNNRSTVSRRRTWGFSATLGGEGSRSQAICTPPRIGPARREPLLTMAPLPPFSPLVS